MVSGQPAMNNNKYPMTDHQSPNHLIIQLQIPKCIILAAGVSTRLRPLTDSKPKCLLEVGGKLLLERTIENVFAAGIKEMALVVGYKAQIIREFVKSRFPNKRLRFILNPNYATTNNAYSLLLARRFLEEKDGTIDQGLLLLDSDILFSSNLLPFLLRNEAKDKIAVRISGKHDEEEIRVSVESNSNIRMIGKEITTAETYRESIGIEIFSPEAVRWLFDTLEKRVRKGIGRTEFYEASFQQMIDEGAKFKAVDVSAFPAIEIDTPHELQIARRFVLDEKRTH